MLTNVQNFYIDGEWCSPIGTETMAVVNPATETDIAEISLGTTGDVDNAVAAAKRAFVTYSKWSVPERKALIERIQAVYERRMGDLGAAISLEIGAPKWLANIFQAGMGWAHFPVTLELLDSFKFEYQITERSKILKKPIGVVGMITPWNWPLNQILCKVLPALATGCTMVLKPSEIAPFNALILAEILDEAGVPKGVFNLVNGDGPTVGRAMSTHVDIDMMSFTGSTRAGVCVAQDSAATVKRVAQELGGKSVNVILLGADIGLAVTNGVNNVMLNSGQTCAAPTRMLVPASLHDEICEIAKRVVAGVRVVDPTDDFNPNENPHFMNEGATTIGPVVSKQQYEKIQSAIQRGINEGATLIAGGLGRPDKFEKGYYVRPTIFANVNNTMSVAVEEIFGPVLCIIPYADEEEALEIANDSKYGLSGYVFGESVDRAAGFAANIETGAVHLNGSPPDFSAPFGGVKQSGNGREWGELGFEEYLEARTLIA